MSNTEPSRDNQPFNQKDYEAHIRRKQAIVHEDEIVRRILDPLGRLDIHEQRAQYREGYDERPVMTVAELYEDPAFEHFPIRLEFRPREPRKSEPPLGKMIDMFPDTLLAKHVAKYVANPWPFNGLDFIGENLGVIYSYEGKTLVLHNRPDFANGHPLSRKAVFKGYPLVTHYFEPFIDDIAERCRGAMATTEASYEAFESNANWRKSNWNDYE